MQHILTVLGFDLHRLFRLRLEHKLVQAQVLDHYCPGSMPITCGASRITRGMTSEERVQWASMLEQAGFIVKSGLGEASAENGSLDQRSAFLDYMALHQPNDSITQLADERFIVQERIDVRAEYRVHSIEDQVIPDLTFSRHTPESSELTLSGRASSFVQSLLDRLPNGLVKDSLYAWDIAIDKENELKVIETNVTGMHPVFKPGFQCSGFFQTPAYSIHCLQGLLSFIRTLYGAQIDVEIPQYPNGQHAMTYWLVALYDSTRRLTSPSSTSSAFFDDISLSNLTQNNVFSPELNTLIWTHHLIRTRMHSDEVSK